MASFVEQATLKIVDQSTKQINQVNRALQQLFATAKKGRSIPIRFDGLKEAKSLTRDLMRDMERLKRPTRLVVDMSALTKATTQARTLNTALNNAARARTARVNVQQMGGAGAGTALPTPVPMRGPYRGVRGIAGIGFGGTGVGFSNLSAAQAIGAVTALTVGQMTVRTLVAESINASRMDLAVDAMTSPEQRAALERQPAVGRNAPVTQRELMQLRAGFIADVLNESPDITAAGAATVADRSIESALRIAEARGISFQEAFDLVQRDLAKAVDLATGDIVDGAGKFNRRAEQVWQAFEDALVLNPDLDSRTIRTATAGTQSARGTMSPDAFFDMAVLASASGQRIGNAWNRAMQNLSGNQREISNERLAALGLFDPATGTAIDQDLLNENLNAWLAKNLFPALRARIMADFEAEGITAPTEEQMRSRMATEVRPLVGRENAASVINELYVAMDAINRQQAQRDNIRASAEERATRRLENFATQLDLTTARMRDTMQNLGDALGETILPAVRGIGDMLHGLNTAMMDGTITPGQVAAGGAVAATGAAIGARALFSSFFNPLNVSATNLNASAAALTRAAAALGGAGAIDGGLGPTRNRAGRLPLTGQGAVGGVMAFTNTLWLGSQIISDVNSTQQELLDGMQRNHERSQALNEALETRLRSVVGDKPVDLLERDILKETTGISSDPTEWADAIRRALSEPERVPIGSSNEAQAARDELASVLKRIDAREAAREAGTLGPSGMEQLETLQQRADELRTGLTEWDAILAENRAAMAGTLDTGAQGINQNIDMAISEGGAMFAGSLNGAFATGADLIASRIVAAIGNTPLRVQQATLSPSQPPDTGAFVPD